MEDNYAYDTLMNVLESLRDGRDMLPEDKDALADMVTRIKSSAELYGVDITPYLQYLPQGAPIDD